EHLATFTGGDREGDRGFFKLLGQILSRRGFGSLALGAALLERLDLLAVGLGQRNGEVLGKEVVAGVAGANLDLVAFGAEAFDGFGEENFAVSHGNRCFVFSERIRGGIAWITRLERHGFVVDVLRGSGGTGSAAGRRTVALDRLVDAIVGTAAAAATTTTGAAIATADQLEVFQHDLQFAALLTGGFVVPLVEL